MAYCRAVWLEGDRTIIGALPSNWIQEEHVFWPKTRSVLHFNRKSEPESTWSMFQLLKIKLTTDNLKEAKNPENDTATDDSEVPSKRRRKTAVRSNSQYYEWSGYSTEEAAKTVKVSAASTRPSQFNTSHICSSPSHYLTLVYVPLCSSIYLEFLVCTKLVLFRVTKASLTI